MASEDESAPKQSRETWSSKLDFLFTTIGEGVGFGNVWRFPYVCYRNGGGVFLIPYLMSVLFIGIPAMFIEGALGQFMSQAALKAWKITPLFQGIGFSQAALCFFSALFYNVILAWVLYYLFSSFTSTLPWSTCTNEWNTPNCRVQHWSNRSVNVTLDDLSLNETNFQPMDPATEFWERKVLQISSGVDNVGDIKWDLALCLFLAWVMVYFCIWKGIKLSGKISYFTVIFAHVLLVVFLVRGLTLPGSAKGIEFFFLPDWTKLASLQVWIEAGIQVFFSYCVGVGVHTSLGSCNEFRHNSLKHQLIFALVNTCTSLLSGFVIFAVLGFMAEKYNVTVAEVAGSGPGLAFVAFPEAVAQMPIAPLWSCIFFILLVLVGIDSQFVQAEAFIVTVGDMYPKLFHGFPRHEIYVGVTCVTWFLIGLSMVTEGGVYVEQLFEWYSGGRILMLVVVLECLIISYVYGINRFQRNIEYMLGYRLIPYFKICWAVITPAVAGGLFIMDIVLYPELTYKRKSGTYYFPAWSRGLGWLLACLCMAFIPGVMIYRLVTTSGTLAQRFRHLLEPDFTDTHIKRDNQSITKNLRSTEDETNIPAEMTTLKE